MKISLDKNELLEKINLAAYFTASQITSSQILQGVLIKGKNKEINIYSSNLNSFFNTKIKAGVKEEFNIIIEPRKIQEFLNLLPAGSLELEVEEKRVVISQKKTKGAFPLFAAGDFPLPPPTATKGQRIPTEEFGKNLEKILFSAARDETRPALTGVNLITNEELTMVTTDGFRLSVVKMKKMVDHPALIIPAVFLETVIKALANKDAVFFDYIKEEKMVVFKTGESSFYSRLIEGEFPPYEKVIPEKHTTSAVLDREELARAIKLIAVFARDLSNVVVVKFGKNEVLVRPKVEEGENSTLLEGKIDGEEQAVAFNYKFILDFLSHTDGKNVIIELLRPDAPVVFRTEKEEGYFHIIMPVRIQE